MTLTIEVDDLVKGYLELLGPRFKMTNEELAEKLLLATVVMLLEQADKLHKETLAKMMSTEKVGMVC